MNRVIPTKRCHNQRKESKMKTWNDITHFAGFDWAKDHHDVLVLDGAGKIVAEFRFDHTASGWTLCQEKLAQFPQVAIAVEAGHSAAIERLVTLDYRVYPVHPRSSKSYRTRKLPSGTKTDRADCWALADALRLEGESWRVLTAPEPLVQQLRLLCRDEVALIEQRTALVNQLQQALYEYYPAALEAFDDWCAPSAWAFVERFPTPQIPGAGRKTQMAKLPARAETVSSRVESKADGDFCQGRSVLRRGSHDRRQERVGGATVKMLQTLEAQLARYRALITECFKQHPDHALFASLPGAGPKLAPRLLGELMPRSSRWPTRRKPCSAWRAWLPSVTSRAKCPWSICATNATASCGPPFICGWTSAAIIATGRASITKRIARRARATPARCAAWECAGSKSSPP
jgi:transposase